MPRIGMKTKIVATVGPASSGEKVLGQLMDKGVDCFRLNFSHGDQAFHRRAISLIRRLSKEKDLPISILLDLQGPKLRVGFLEGGRPVHLRKGDRVLLRSGNEPGTRRILTTSYANLAKDVKQGDRILLDDGNLELRVLRKVKGGVECLVKRGGILTEKKGINLPGIPISVPSFTPKDRKDLRFGLENGVDYVALSFVRTSKDLGDVKRAMKREGRSVPVIAKIEKPEAVEHLEEILEIADGIMVARGDLGVEMSPAEVPILQKRMIQEANRKGVLAITATQMLESMIWNAQPTRAEASDVANAILDGTDGIMLSGETAVGKHPVAAVEFMSAIAMEAEKNRAPLMETSPPSRLKEPISHAMVRAACYAADEIRAKALVVFSISGETVQLLSKMKPKIPIVGLSPDSEVVRRLSLCWGTFPFQVPFGGNTDEMIRSGEELLFRKKILKRGDTVVIVAGSLPMRGATNMIKVLRM